MIGRFLFLSWFFFISVIFSFEVQQHVTPNMISLGDEFLYEINVTYQDTESLLNIPSASDFFPFELKDSNINKHKEGDLWTVSIQYVLTLFSIEDSIIPTQSLKFSSNNVFSMAELDPVSMTLRSLLKTGEEGQYTIENITDPYVLTIYWKQYVWHIISLVVLLLILFGGAWYFFKYKQEIKMRVDEEVVDARSSLQIALDAFSELNPSLVRDELTLKQFYLMLTNIIKQYLGAVYDSNVPEMTTTEVLTFICDELGAAFQKKLNTILGQSDLVKFARFKPEQEHHHLFLEKAVSFVNAVDEKHGAKMSNQTGVQV